MLVVPRSLPTWQWQNWLVLLVTMSTLYFLLSSACSRCVASWSVWTRRTERPLSSSAVACARLVLLVTLHLALCSLCLSAGPLPGHGRVLVDDSGGSTRLVLLVTMHIASAFRCLEVPQVQFLRLWPSLCSRTVEVPQIQFIAPFDDIPVAQ